MNPIITPAGITNDQNAVYLTSDVLKSSLGPDAGIIHKYIIYK